ncbi:hypothetical protein [Spiroplasma endosymbiont of Polydrusus cervinus]|uniref:hypothetical protein n=1 Tax=Spiroplasma endosymbiont of Polydrusus cervinus TaxID=3066287 RepID=UPI0030CE12F9
MKNITLQQKGYSQTDKVNFDNTITLYTDNITNEIKTFATGYTNRLLKKTIIHMIQKMVIE